MADSGNKKSLFWTSYSDLMTSLFFAMLVLFVVVVIAMGKANKKLNDALHRANITIEQQNQVLKLQEQFHTLANSTSLEFDEEKRMFYAKDFVGIEIFEPNDAEIKTDYIEKVDEVGKDIKNIIDSLSKSSDKFKYQLVIEGTAAIPYKELRAGTYNKDDYDMYLLSYRRALALYKRWQHFNFRESNTEIIIAGSGFNGINRDNKIEDNNKRFVIQIIPKIDRPSDR
jgi:Ca2+/Na+ antiporter